tara:strand:- start:99881 stop:104086 length:4206 start_codon:yes stop_codon:yes gene_type:complete
MVNIGNQIIMNLRIFLLVLCCLINFYSRGQFNNFKFENLDTVDGLSSSTCLTIFQDSEGFLWFGTIDGLNKYNGYEFEVYKSILNDPSSISNNRINAIVEDTSGNLWIGTNNGLNYFDKKTKRFLRVDLYQQLSLANNPRKFINDLFFDNANNVLWVATNNGVIKIIVDEFERDVSDLKFYYYLNDDSSLNSLDNNIVNVIFKDQDDVIWVGTNGAYLNKYDKERDNFDRVLIENKNDYELNHIPKNVFVDADNDFWIGNNLSNMIFWDRANNIFSHKTFTSEKDIAVRDMHLDKDGNIWASTDGHGLFLLNKTKNQVIQHLVSNFSDSFSLPNNKPSKIYEDKSGILWIGSYDKGVSKLDPSQYAFGHYYYQPGNPDGLNEKIVQSVLEDSKERIWISAYNGGLNLFDKDTNTFKHFLHDPNNVNSISSDKILYTFESNDGQIWVCTLDGGLSRFNPDNYKVKRFLHKESDVFSIGQNSVWSGVEDNDNRLWFGLRTEGLSLFDPDSEKFYNFKNIAGKENGLASNFVFFLFVDSRNRLFVGTSLGLNYLDLNQLESRIPEALTFKEIKIPGIEDNLVNYITEDYLGNIWVGSDTGIYKLDPESNLLKSYSSKEGLPNNLVVGIEEDDNHNFWVTSKSGLSFLNPETNQIKNFNIHDGLQGPEYQSKSIDKTSDGRILIGGINGFNIFHPDDITLRPSANISPIITQFTLNNKPVVVGDTVNNRVLLTDRITEIEKLKLNYDENYVAFDFLALHFENPERVQYAYKLFGLDNDFETIGSKREITYSNLDPGKYVFEVKASLDGNWDKAEAAIVNFEVLSPPWKTWWAYLFYTLFGILVFYLVMRYYTQKVKEGQEHELDQMKLQFFVNVSHEFRTPLTLILNPVDKILSSINESSPMMTSAQTIQRSARRLLHLVNQLLDYRKMDVGMMPLQLEKGNIVEFSEDIFMLFKGLAEQKELDYKFTSDSKKILAHFDLDKVEKIITNLISNAIKFTPPEGRIEVSIHKVSKKVKTYDSFFMYKEKMGDYVELVVKDSGKGLDKTQLKNVFSRFYNLDLSKTGTGIGLNFTKALIEMHGGDISVESQAKVGSKFIVRMPLNLDKEATETESIKNEFRINSMKAVEYDMLTTNELVTYKDDVTTANNKERPTILIIEDNKELRTHLTNDLSEFYQVRQAANGEKGLRAAKKHFPDVIISDVMMPVMDGFELCKKIKSEFETCHIPVLLLTAKSLDDDRVEGYHSGADAYLSKPFVTRVLIARINNLLETKKRLRQRFSEIGGIFPASEVTTNSIDEVFLDRVTKTILKNVADMDFKQEDLLKELGVGRSQLYRKINSLTGNNPSHYMRTVRLRHAAELLKENRYSIKEISYMTGFNSTAYFSKTFRELFNVTPTEFIGKQEGEEL